METKKASTVYKQENKHLPLEGAAATVTALAGGSSLSIKHIGLRFKCLHLQKKKKKKSYE